MLNKINQFRHCWWIKCSYELIGYDHSIDDDDDEHLEIATLGCQFFFLKMFQKKPKKLVIDESCRDHTFLSFISFFRLFLSDGHPYPKCRVKIKSNLLPALFWYILPSLYRIFCRLWIDHSFFCLIHHCHCRHHYILID